MGLCLGDDINHNKVAMRVRHLVLIMLSGNNYTSTDGHL